MAHPASREGSGWPWGGRTLAQGFLWSPAIPWADAEHLLLTGELPEVDPITKKHARLPSD